MSDAVTELGGRVTAGWVTVRDAGLRGMITLRGDLTSQALQSVCTKLTGVDFPRALEAKSDGHRGLCWMAADEVLVRMPYSEVSMALSDIKEALHNTHFMAENVSDARAVIFVEGAGAREVMAKLTPVDMHRDTFPVGHFRRSRLGQIAAAFWMHDDETFEVICFRSVGDYAFALLAESADAGPVGVF